MQATAATLASTATGAPASELFIATNTYPWGTFFGREKKNFPVHSDEMLAAIAYPLFRRPEVAAMEEGARAMASVGAQPLPQSCCPAASCDAITSRGSRRM